jgi:hypothetical protein
MTLKIETFSSLEAAKKAEAAEYSFSSGRFLTLFHQKQGHSGEFG